MENLVLIKRFSRICGLKRIETQKQHYLLRIVPSLLLLCSVTLSASISVQDCPRIAFVKRPHFDRPFGIGSIISWDIYKPGGGIYIYDPATPKQPLSEIFRRDDGVIFDMSMSFDAKKILFAWRKCSDKTKIGPLTVSRVFQSDTLEHVMKITSPESSDQKPNHSFWDRKGQMEWARVDLGEPRAISQIAVYWFDDQVRNGGCKVPKTWRLLYKHGQNWVPVTCVNEYGTETDCYNRLHFDAVETDALKIEIQCYPDKSAGIQRLQIGTEKQHADILATFEERDQNNPETGGFHIYEINIDGSGLKQLTYEPYNDIHPFYLPNGKIGFVSTRVRAYLLCQPSAACALHVMDADGSNIKRIHFGTLADHSPYLLDNGSILFTRWEYQDKDLTYLQGLWTINPDGTRVQLFFGNTILEPAVIWQAKPIPETSKVLCTLAPHHGNPVGAIGIIDRSRGLENPMAITNLTPEIDYNPARNARGPGDRQYQWAYRDPWPIDENLFAVSYGGGGTNRYRLFLMDAKGQKTLLYEDQNISCFNPIPLLVRNKPHNIRPIDDSSENFGMFLVTDIYRGMTGVKRGDVKAIRIMKVIPKSCNMRGSRAYDMDPLMSRGTYYAKYCYGTVPVDENGCAYFKAPADVELYFQAIDADGKELCRMGSVTQIMPGEMQSCIGCHESRFTAPPNAATVKQALSKGCVDITPPQWGAGPVDFATQVQPVLNRYCVSCHSGPNPNGAIDLSGDKTRFFNMAYDTLTEKRFIHYNWLLNDALVRAFLPLESGSRVSRLTELIESGHGNVNIDDESRHRIYNWIDSNVPYYGTYEHTRPGLPGSRDACTGTEWFAAFSTLYDKQCSSCHGTDFFVENSGDHHTWINLTHPQWSRVLTAPLVKSAGGLELCRLKDGTSPKVFQRRSDVDYLKMLAAIERGKKQLYQKPRMDMPGAKPLPYPENYVGPYSSFAGP
ncbi:MAG: hypothetical protein JXA82_10710 [Sedimentisphaerales bacterium]|nr:hypothetical protein [Sedimentisphaerales bacterium]